MCSTVAPLARGAGGDIPSKGLGQGFTRSSTFTHLLGAAGAPTGVPSGAADGCPSMPKVVLRPSVSVFHAVFCGGGTHHTPLSAAIAKNRVSNASGGPENVQRMFFNHMHCICPNDSCNELRAARRAARALASEECIYSRVIYCACQKTQTGDRIRQPWCGERSACTHACSRANRS